MKSQQVLGFSTEYSTGEPLHKVALSDRNAEGRDDLQRRRAA